ncbi:LysR substrate-binding domain-containing protein, partial [Bacillus licheniformis]|nr:LysR substrate-binding domain-containing protein [Bacillus licheniformis]
SSMVARTVGAVPMATCASPAYIARHGLPRTLDDLRMHRAINFFTGRNRRVLEWTFRPHGDTVAVKLASSLLTDNSEALLSCGLAGLGIVHALRPALQPSIDSGQLVELLPGVPAVPKPVSVLYPNRAHLPDKVRAFIDWLTDLFARRYPA